MTTCSHSETVVPLGGARIPEGMGEHADWKSLPVVEDSQTSETDCPDFGEGYDKVVKARLLIQKAKKSMTKLMQDVKPFLLAMEKGDEGERKTAEEKMNESKTDLEGTCTEISNCTNDALTHFRSDEAKIRYGECLPTIEEALNAASTSAAQAFQDCDDLLKESFAKVGTEGNEIKEIYGDILLKTNKILSALFRHQNKLMDIVKTVKKTHQK